MSPLAGIVLCGGRSSRMGQDKADLMIGGEPLLARTVRTLSVVADPIVIAAAADQHLPSLPPNAMIVRDMEPENGPLPAFVQALGTLAPECEWTFLLAC